MAKPSPPKTSSSPSSAQQDPANAFTGNTVGFVFPSVGFDAAPKRPDVTIVTDRAQRCRISSPPVCSPKSTFTARITTRSCRSKKLPRSPVGTGSYRLTEWVRDDYHAARKGRRFHPAPRASTRFTGASSPKRRPARLNCWQATSTSSPTSPPDQVDAINGSGTAAVQAVAGHAPYVRRLQASREAFADSPGYDAIQNTAVRRRFAVRGRRPDYLLRPCSAPNANAPAAWSTRRTTIPTCRPIPMTRRWQKRCWTKPATRATKMACASRSPFQGPRGRYLNDARCRQSVST